MRSTRKLMFGMFAGLAFSLILQSQASAGSVQNSNTVSAVQSGRLMLTQVSGNWVAVTVDGTGYPLNVSVNTPTISGKTVGASAGTVNPAITTLTEGYSNLGMQQ